MRKAPRRDVRVIIKKSENAPNFLNDEPDAPYEKL